MLGKQIKFGWLVGAMVLVGCHTANEREAVQNVLDKETLKPPAHVLAKKAPTIFFEVTNTKTKNGILKIERYNNGLIECSLNGLSDTITTSNPYMSWKEINWMVDGDGNNQSIFTPGSTKPLSYILNDSLLIINGIDSRGRVNLFLLNRTPHTLKFARGNTNPIRNYSTYVYVDLKHNVIINHGSQYIQGHNTRSDMDDPAEDISKNIYSMGGWETPQNYTASHSPYFIYRYRIINGTLVETDIDTTFFKTFSKIDVNYPDGARQFYQAIASGERWEQNKFIPHE